MNEKMLLFSNDLRNIINKFLNQTKYSKQYHTWKVVYKQSIALMISIILF